MFLSHSCAEKDTRVCFLIWNNTIQRITTDFHQKLAFIRLGAMHRDIIRCFIQIQVNCVIIIIMLTSYYLVLVSSRLCMNLMYLFTLVTRCQAD